MADGLVITGPTAAGKTALSIHVAQRIAGEIISMDSRQIFRGMSVGTAKPGQSQQANVRHFGIDILHPGERYSAGRFARDARRWVADITARTHTPILVGGSGFFLRALTHPLFEEPFLDPRRREQLKQYLRNVSTEELHRWLTALDDVSARRLATAGGRQRAARAIEIALLTGRALPAWHALQTPALPLDLVIFVLQLPRPVLYRRIDDRVDAMIAHGLVEEVESLMSAGFNEHSPGMNTTGYIELVAYLRGETTLEAAVAAIKRATRNYARRQETWFRHQLSDAAITLDAEQPADVMAAEIVTKWRSVTAADSNHA